MRSQNNQRHVYHLLTAYVHRQLPRAQRTRVMQHIQMCGQCRAALAQEEQLVRDFQAYLPALGKPATGQMARVWTRIHAEINQPSDKSSDRPSGGLRLPSVGVAIMAIILCAFVASAFFSDTRAVTAAPFQAVPADVEATWTPIVTERPGAIAMNLNGTETPIPSREAKLLTTPPAALAVPPPR